MSTPPKDPTSLLITRGLEELERTTRSPSLHPPAGSSHALHLTNSHTEAKALTTGLAETPSGEASPAVKLGQRNYFQAVEEEERRERM
ncbi:hypothetical protein HK097_003528, partial [Rhizophlyctis rosea]